MTEETTNTTEEVTTNIVPDDVPIICDNGFIRPMTQEEIDEIVNTPLPDETPMSIHMRQLRLELYNRSQLTPVGTAINKLTGDQTPIKIDWEYATSVDRDGILFQYIATFLSLTEEDVKDFFKAASLL